MLARQKTFIGLTTNIGANIPPISRSMDNMEARNLRILPYTRCNTSKVANTTQFMRESYVPHMEMVETAEQSIHP
jgi:hypothetical protein